MTTLQKKSFLCEKKRSEDKSQPRDLRTHLSVGAGMCSKTEREVHQRDKNHGVALCTFPQTFIILTWTLFHHPVSRFLLGASLRGLSWRK